jgi:hypothetical protein
MCYTYLLTHSHTYLLTYLLTHSLTPWSKVLLEKLTDSRIVKKSPAFYGNRRCITAFAGASVWTFRNMTHFYGEDLLAPRPTLNWGPPLSAVLHWLFKIFAATLHMGRRSSFRNLRTRHVVVTGTHLGDPGIEWRIILRRIFRKWNMDVWTG